MARFSFCRVLACLAVAVIIPGTALAQQGTAPPEKLKLVWPDPTPEELAILPDEGCKELEEIDVPDEETTPRADYIAWQKTPDGVCWEWYKLHFNESYVFGDVPPDGRTDPYPPSLMTEEHVKARAERKKIQR